MKYDDPNLIEMLAREYVLGTLRGQARGRFERLLQDNRRVRRAVVEWEQRLLPLSLELAPVQPPAEVWRRIAGQVERPAPTRGLRTASARFWRMLTVSFAAASLVLGSLLFVERSAQRVALPPPSYVSIIADADEMPLWLLQVQSHSGELEIVTIGKRSVQPDRGFELWMLPNGEAPVSLGLLPTDGRLVLKLSARQLDVLKAVSTLAVSLEPAGGSPTGQPTGPVLHTAMLLRT